MRPREPRSVDFAGGVHPLLTAYRTVIVVLELEAPGRVVGPDLHALAAWVPRFDGWFRGAAGIDRGRRLQLLYRRELGVVTPITPEHWDMLRPVAAACRGTGMGFGLTLDVGRCADPASVRAMLAADIDGVAIAFDADTPPLADLRPVLDAVLDSGVRVSFSGPIGPLLASGLLREPAWSGRHVSIDPTPTRPVGEVARRAEPCLRRFRLCIDSDGTIYPCSGLVGCADARLGHIREPVERTVLGGRPTALDLEALARRGPVLPAAPRPARSTTGLPVVCEEHRELWLEDTRLERA